MDVTMDAKLNSGDVSDKMDADNADKPEPSGSIISASQSPMMPDNSITEHTESLAEVTISSALISTEDTELSSADISVNVFPNKAKANLHDNPTRDQPKPLRSLMSSSVGTCTANDVSHSQTFTSITRDQESLKTTTVNTQPDGDDLCAAILLACLFCHPLDCLLATIRGCNECVWSLCSSLCSSLCGCEPTALQPLLDATHHCDICGCLGVRCFLCDCPICDICLQATECLDLAMEISQMLYH